MCETFVGCCASAGWLKDNAAHIDRNKIRIVVMAVFLRARYLKDSAAIHRRESPLSFTLNRSDEAIVFSGGLFTGHHRKNRAGRNGGTPRFDGYPCGFRRCRRKSGQASAIDPCRGMEIILASNRAPPLRLQPLSATVRSIRSSCDPNRHRAATAVRRFTTQPQCRR